MRNKTVLITGASLGVGLASAKALAARGARVIIVSRDQARGVSAKADVGAVATGPEPVLMLADLASQREIRSLAAQLHDPVTQLDVLINNASAIFSRRELTVDGIERTLAINHVARFLLTTLVVDLVRAAPAGRIVNVTSESHAGSIDFSNLQGEKHYNFLSAYLHSKLANILFTYDLDAQLAGTSVTANCVSPGPTKTGFGRELTGLRSIFPRVMKSIPFLFRDPAVGAETVVYAASSSDLDGVSGKFLLRCRVRRSKAVTYDVATQLRLRRYTESL
jgi:NAD(P)-dependent dehydrogenase (short-subunit alcohol dehydrogenase family)